ncbi:MAG: phosphatidylinositol-specific phospholipase C/glycerophosphodiester phosphodiesterase family protein [Saprospiraceae bacterium]|nr:phosphatidylinositol-specific phospholipase C/glycerophosphodiester phosphodiesterase family protein [Saprospiraceae bacterium]
MISIRLTTLLLAIAFLHCSQEIKVINGHAHNDYENKIPLTDAIENGFISVEVDVYLVEDDLYVAHDFPNQLNPDLTLEELYLIPLQDHIRKNNGFVYDNYSDPFYLMIDFKSEAKSTYEKLKEILSKFKSILSITRNGVEQTGPVKVFISGNRPVREILNDEPKLVGIDGRPDELKDHVPASIMPIVSDNYSNVLTWSGQGAVLPDEMNFLTRLVQNTRAQNKKLRLWAAPDNEIAWKFLLDNGVDLINTDRLADFKAFSLQYDSTSH